MFAKNWNVSDCIGSFGTFAKPIFSPFAERSTGTFDSLITTVRVLLNGELCSTEAARSSFESSFGGSSTLFGRPSGGIARARYAVTGTNTDKATAIVFSNYGITEPISRVPVVNDTLKDGCSAPGQPFSLTTHEHLTGNVRLWEA